MKIVSLQEARIAKIKTELRKCFLPAFLFEELVRLYRYQIEGPATIVKGG